MDNITHGLIGALIGSASLLDNEASSQERKAFFLCAIIGSEIPDIDVCSGLVNGLAYLKWHRGPTHSLFGLILLSLLIFMLARNSFPETRSSRLFLSSFIAVFTHALFDLLTSYGTMLLFPLRNTRYALDILPIVDIYLLAMLGFGLFVLFYFRRRSRTIFVLLLTAIFLYIGTRTGIHWYAEKVISREISLSHAISSISVIPGFTNPLCWQFIVQTHDRYITGEFEIPNQVKKEMEYPLYNPQAISLPVLNSKDAQIFMSFARYPVISIHQSHGQKKIIITDLRYQFKGRSHFNYLLTLDKQGKVVSSRLGDF